ncbi:MAG: sigma-70 family RNA polymerase sigma factor [Bacteroidales bacterium]|nr:sigma-70 family RNA polymerase sigma factor [Bacteroidales bacterium]
MKVKPLEYQDKKDDNKNIDDIIAKNEQAITRLYNMYRNEFIGFFVKEYSIRSDDAAEIYQESFISMYQNIVNGKLTTINFSLKTYLFKIGKYKIFYRFRDARPMEELCTTMPDINSEEGQHIQETVYEVVSAMGNPCSQLLSLFYWERKNMKEIATVMNYKNEQVAKNRKSSCMKKLKEQLIIRFKEEELI